ncbi:unnamed protein product [Onchocerca flexuosa]|uniref:Ovule protein n=1 Tax=Onchocerca flexuosa TaxID=387005 RepID=A0A183H1K1_9BILA|nr:unnamed protein product [Onchocerca flexuosa]
MYFSKQITTSLRNRKLQNNYYQSYCLPHRLLTSTAPNVINHKPPGRHENEVPSLLESPIRHYLMEKKKGKEKSYRG